MMTTLHDMFALSLPLTEKILRPIVVYLFLVVGLRLAGKRELAQLNPLDFVVLMTLSNTVQNAIIGEDNSVTGGIIGATTLIVVNHLMVRFLYRHRDVDRVLEGDACVLIADGKVRHKVLERELITQPELEAAAHKQGFRSLSDVDHAVLETGGGISFFARAPSPEVKRHRELLTRLDAIEARLPGA